MTNKKEFVGINPELFTELKQEDIDNPEWLVEIDGQLIPYRQGARFFNLKRGLEYRLGRRADGFVGVIDHEPGGGGAFIVPWVDMNRVLYVGLLQQRRVTQGLHRDVWNVPRGYMDPDETHFDTAKREFSEKTGFRRLEQRIILLRGEPVNSNSAKQDTSRPSEGARFYHLEILVEEITKVAVEVHNYYQDILTVKPKELYTLNRDVMGPMSETAERIMACCFFPYNVAMRLGDLFTRGIVGTLKTELEEQRARKTITSGLRG